MFLLLLFLNREVEGGRDGKVKDGEMKGDIKGIERKKQTWKEGSGIPAPSTLPHQHGVRLHQSNPVGADVLGRD